MGGSSTRSQSKQQSTDNKVVVSGYGNTALGRGAAQTNNQKSVGIGGRLVEAGAMSIENKGILVGEGSSYHSSSMDQNTANLLDTAMTMVSANAENVFELAAARDGVAGDMEFMNPKKIDVTARAKKPASAKSKIGLAVVVLIGFALIKRKKK